MNEKLDLLIIYRDGEEKIITNVDDSGINEEGCFYCKKGKYRSFIPVDTVKFFGRVIDYKKRFYLFI